VPFPRPPPQEIDCVDRQAARSPAQQRRRHRSAHYGKTDKRSTKPKPRAPAPSPRAPHAACGATGLSSPRRLRSSVPSVFLPALPVRCLPSPVPCFSPVACSALVFGAPYLCSPTTCVCTLPLRSCAFVLVFSSLPSWAPSASSCVLVALLPTLSFYYGGISLIHYLRADRGYPPLPPRPVFLSSPLLVPPPLFPPSLSPQCAGLLYSSFPSPSPLAFARSISFLVFLTFR